MGLLARGRDVRGAAAVAEEAVREAGAAAEGKVSVELVGTGHEVEAIFDRGRVQ